MLRGRYINCNIFLISGLLAAAILLSGCGDKKVPRPAPKAAAPKSVPAAPPPQPTATAIIAEDAPVQQGYIYERNNRRDPFVPLVIPKKLVIKKPSVKEGTLESYELKDFALAAIAHKGAQHYALLVTPDNRSFTVFEGTRLGTNNGKVKKITGGKVFLVEYTKDHKGKSIPREIILEFYKGE